jgi:hypothetical protein
MADRQLHDRCRRSALPPLETFFRFSVHGYPATAAPQVVRLALKRPGLKMSPTSHAIAHNPGFMAKVVMPK